MYNPAEYWEQRLIKNFSLKGVGHQSYSLFYNKWLYKRKQQMLESIFCSTNLKGKTILDIGSGVGFFLKWYLSKGSIPTGIDISQTAIRLLRQRYPQLELLHDNFSESKIVLSKTYDIINAWDIIYHQTDDQHFLTFLKNCAMACKPGGLFICTDGFGFPQSFVGAKHVKFRNLQDYQILMKNLGFELKKEYPLYRFLNRTSQKSRIYRYCQNIISPLLFLLDQFQQNPAKDNLSISVWVKTGVISEIF